MALCPEHPKRDQNPKFTPLSETTSIPVCFIWESPPPGSKTARKVAQVKERGGGEEERKETLADKPQDFKNHPLGLSCLN